MKLPRRNFLHLAAGAAALPALSRFAWAQAYPTRPITMIVPSTPGSAGDAVARLVAERMRRSLRQPIIMPGEDVGAASPSRRRDAQEARWQAPTAERGLPGPVRAASNHGPPVAASEPL
jgi:hypothetical protein